jgi:hypothetical protein
MAVVFINARLRFLPQSRSASMATSVSTGLAVFETACYRLRRIRDRHEHTFDEIAREPFCSAPCQKHE